MENKSESYGSEDDGEDNFHDTLGVFFESIKPPSPGAAVGSPQGGLSIAAVDEASAENSSGSSDQQARGACGGKEQLNTLNEISVVPPLIGLSADADLAGVDDSQSQAEYAQDFDESQLDENEETYSFPNLSDSNQEEEFGDEYNDAEFDDTSVSAPPQSFDLETSQRAFQDNAQSEEDENLYEGSFEGDDS